MDSFSNFVTSWPGVTVTPIEYLWDLKLRPRSLLPEDHDRFAEWAHNIAEHLELAPRDIHRMKLQLIRANVLAASYRNNPRRLEERWSGFWQIIIQFLANSVQWGPFIVFHQFNLWRLNRDEHSLEVLEIPVFKAPNSSLLPSSGESGGESANASMETSKIEVEELSVYFFQHVGKGGDDDDKEEVGDDDGSEGSEGEAGDESGHTAFFNPAEGRPPFFVQAASREIAPSALPAQKPLDGARLEELENAPFITHRRPRPQVSDPEGASDGVPIDDGLADDVPDYEEFAHAVPVQEVPPRAEDATRSMHSQVLSRGSFSCQITDIALCYAPGLEALDDVSYAGLAQNFMDAAQVKRDLCNGWSIDLEWIPIILENKRLPKRRRLYQRDGVNIKAILVFLEKAKAQALKQAAYLFTSLRWRNQDELVAITASGDWWSWAIVTLTKGMRERRENDRDSAEAESLDYDPDDSVLRQTVWSRPMRYGSLESCLEMDKIRAWLKAFVAKIDTPMPEA